ncbi:helix-turn-helix domain-containing protein [Streptomyces sp. NPDC000927]|uniref:helix-turn-helix domain-containing protein n=1 Tax=Streptomyces sp. NPDC000927 TaxID=3154371 RepID=UPI00332469DE
MSRVVAPGRWDHDPRRRVHPQSAECRQVKPKGLIGTLLQLRKERRAHKPTPPTVQNTLDELREHLRGTVHRYETASIDRKATAVWVVDCGMTAKEAAAIVGVHENTIGSWRREAQALQAKRQSP